MCTMTFPALIYVSTCGKYDDYTVVGAFVNDFDSARECARNGFVGPYAVLVFDAATGEQVAVHDIPKE